MFGGWKTAFTLGYGLPLQDFLFESKGKRFLNVTYGSSIKEIVIDNLIVKVVLPEGSSDLSASTPFPVTQREETKISHLDIDGRPVVVLEKTNVVPEHSQYFQVYYKFTILSMLREPLMLIFGFFCFFLACIVYVHVDLSISKSSASYLAKLQWDEVRATIQQLQSVINQRLAVHDKLDASLHDLSRTGDVHACKLARKTADGLLKEYSKELKPLLSYLHSDTVEELVAKERELQDRLMAKHLTIVDCYDRKLSRGEIESRVAAVQQEVLALRQEVEDLLDYIDEI